MIMTLLMLFLPTLFLSILVVLLTKSGMKTFLVLFAIGLTIVITGTNSLDAGYLIIPILIFAVCLYMIFFGGGNNE